MAFKHQTDLLGRFAQHKVAANLFMLIMILAGVWALGKLNTQFLPSFELDIVSVRVVWSGASAEDVERSITALIEQELRDLDGLKKLTSTSTNGVSSVTVEFVEGADMGMALDQVNQRVALLRNLPASAEKPEVSHAQHYEMIARLLLSGPQDVNELRHLARRVEDELSASGISKTSLNGLPEQEVAIQISSASLNQLGLSLDEVGRKISAASRDLPAGFIGREDVARQLRSLDQRRDESGFAELPLLADAQGRLLRLGEVAEIERRPRQGQTLLSYQGKPAVEIVLFRAAGEDALKAARIFDAWLAEARHRLPQEVQLTVYDQTWHLIQERIMLLVKNGGGGLVLVVLILYLFLNGRVALWVAVGIPVSLLATQAGLYLSGGSINMISLFAMIMALGIIVDDAIVVGEDALAHYQYGEDPLQAAEGGARRMLAPVIASSLTTIATFLPLMLVGGVMGTILFAIPLVMVCVILASLVESFLILPGHLRQSFHHMHHNRAAVNPLRLKLERAFERLRDDGFRPLLVVSLRYRWVTLSLTLAVLVLSVGLLAGGRINFHFFPSPDSTMITANVSFAAGTPPGRVDAFLERVEEALHQTDARLGGGLVQTVVVRYRSSSVMAGQVEQRGDQFGSLLVELSGPDQRDIRNAEILSAWREAVPLPPGLETFTVTERQGGPPGRDIDIRLSGADTERLKNAALELAEVLKTYTGVSAVEDDMPYGREQLIYRLRPQAVAQGLSVEDLGRQLRAAYDGSLAQIFTDGKDEVEVRVMLPDAERYRLASLEGFSVKLPNGASMLLSNAVEWAPRQGFEALRHYRGELSVQVSADVDPLRNNSNNILSELEQGFLPDFASRYGLRYSLEGRSADQAETLGDMKRGLVLALALMYLILAWVFSSYGWPLLVMLVIPFGLVGALLGHQVMGLDLTILSLFGFFGLSGIVVNDSIVLVTFYRHQREAGKPIRAALEEAACQRLRAVLLTSLTTIGGLLPLLFESSLQAQFLIPMATSISFGLMFSTVLVLLVMPSLLSLYEDFMHAGSEVERVKRENHHAAVQAR